MIEVDVHVVQKTWSLWNLLFHECTLTSKMLCQPVRESGAWPACQLRLIGIYPSILAHDAKFQRGRNLGRFCWLSYLKLEALETMNYAYALQSHYMFACKWIGFEMKVFCSNMQCCQSHMNHSLPCYFTIIPTFCIAGLSQIKGHVTT